MINTIRYLSKEEIEIGLPEVQASPGDNGLVRAIVIRPGTDERVSLQKGRLSREGGLEGDRWTLRQTRDGRDFYDDQITLMNARVAALLAQDESRWALAGDQFYVDLDLSNDNLKPGDRLKIGTAVLEVTPLPHNGCKKFARRYGKDAIRFINSPIGKHLHMRGIYARVLQDGDVQVGDTICKL